MADADGSVRIDVSVSDEEAKKQIEKLTNDIQKQTDAVERQEEKVKKLAAQWEKVSQGGAKGEKLRAELKKTEDEIARMGAQFESVLSKIDKAEVDVFEKQKQAKVDHRKWEEYSIAYQELSKLKDKSDGFADSLSKAEERAEQLRRALAQTVEASTQSAAGQSVVDSLQNAQDKLDDMNASLAENKAELQTFTDEVNRRIQANTSTVGKLKSALAGMFSGLKNLASEDVGKTIDEIKDKFKSFGKTSAKHVDNVSKKVGNLSKQTGRFGARLRSIVAGALFFNIISRSLTALTQNMGKALLANKAFANSFGQIKSNLLTAFQPIYESVLPWLNMLMEALSRVTAQMAQFIASVFGMTAQQAQDNAKALYEQADATEETAKAAEEAEKALAGFDTIQKLGSTKKTGQKQDQQQAGESEFNTDFSQVQTPQWLTDFWKVFQDSWAQYGQATIDTAKEALEALKGAVSAVGAAFMQIWTNGTGLTLLNNLQILLQTILGIIASIANAFRVAWNENNAGAMLLQTIMNLLNTIVQIAIAIGQAFRTAWESGNMGQIMLAAILDAATKVFSLANSIGQAFLAAWNQSGLGVSIFGHIFSIITNIANTIGNLAQQIQTAWEANSNGQMIWEAILGIIDSIAGTIDRITAATAEWAASLNFEPLMGAIKILLEAIKNLIDTIGNTLANVYESVILPMLGWVIETALPALITLLGNMIDFFAEHEIALQVLTGLVVGFIAAWKLVEIIQNLGKLAGAVAQVIGIFVQSPVLAIIALIVAGVVLLIANWKKVKETVENVVNAIVGFIETAIDAVKSFFSAIGEGISSGVSSLFGRGSSGGASAPRGITAYSLEGIPHLASGAVISPNNEFLAILGDQKAGTNIETPLSTMIEAFNAALDARGGGNTPVNVTVEFTGTDAQLARALNPIIRIGNQLSGANLVQGGAYG